MNVNIVPEIETSRLRLIRLTDTSTGSQHVQWFHEDWSDDITTSWSLHGKCHSIEESQQWFIHHLTEFDNIIYAVFTKDSNSEHPGEHIGSIGLRAQKGGPTLPPFPNGDAVKPINLRSIGYAFFQKAWGKGYATEAGKAAVDAYREAIAEEKAKGEQNFYIEAGWDKDNSASQNVLRKLGFQEVGWKEVPERVFLNGAWREPGYWIWGMYL